MSLIGTPNLLDAVMEDGAGPAFPGEPGPEVPYQPGDPPEFPLPDIPENPVPYLPRDSFPDFLRRSLSWPEAGGKYERSYDIPEKTIKKPVIYDIISTDEKVLTAELKWEKMEAKFAPDDNTPG